jgi:hypothetical protein
VRRIASVWKVDRALRLAIEPASSSEQLPKVFDFFCCALQPECVPCKTETGIPALSIHSKH